MKICITSKGKNLDSDVDTCFGRSGYFLFVDTESLEFEAVKNENAGSKGGAGIDSAFFVAKKGIEALLTTHCGPNAFHALKAAKIDVILDVTGTVREAVERFKKGELEAASGPDVMPDFGVSGR